MRLLMRLVERAAKPAHHERDSMLSLILVLLGETYPCRFVHAFVRILCRRQLRREKGSWRLWQNVLTKLETNSQSGLSLSWAVYQSANLTEVRVSYTSVWQGKDVAVEHIECLQPKLNL